jgi:hypothetical protein
MGGKPPVKFAHRASEICRRRRQVRDCVHVKKKFENLRKSLAKARAVWYNIEQNISLHS